MLILQLMIVRLRKTLLAINDPQKSMEMRSRYGPELYSKRGRININFISLSACSGCAAGLLRNESELHKLLESANISYSALLMDRKNIGYADITIVDGAVRSREEEEKLRNIRGKSRIIVAWGTCAAYGGIPVYANQYELEELIEESYGRALDPFSYYLSGKKTAGPGSYQYSNLEMLRKAGKVDDHIKVDYYLPGCPSHISLLTQLISELSGKNKHVKIPAIVCAECSRKPFKCPSEYTSAFPMTDGKSDMCLNAQGMLCPGFMIRGGCGAACPKGGLPCWCCRGPSDITLKKMVRGKSLEKVLLDYLTNRCKLKPNKITPMLHTLCKEGNSLLNFDNYFTHNRDKIR
jgi:F420-non-reducing hydrogenase small subunit